MIGKIFYKEMWHLCMFQSNTLEIFHFCVDKPLSSYDNINLLKNENLLLGFFENNDTLIFDIKSGNKIEFIYENEYIELKIEKINYFKSINNFFKQCDFNKIKKVVFVNGILKAMLEKPEIGCVMEPIDISFIGESIKIEFNIEKVKDNFLLNINETSKMLTNNFSTIVEYKLIATPNNNLSFEYLNKFIDYIIKFISFYNFDASPFIEKIIVETENSSFLYMKNTINFNKKCINRWNFLYNCDRRTIEVMLEKIQYKKYDIGFLSLLDSNEIIEEDIWRLSKSIDSIVSLKKSETNNDKTKFNEENIKNKTDNDKSIHYDELRKEIKSVIDNFEKTNECKIEDYIKKYILNFTNFSTLKQKIIIIFDLYNEFVENSYFAKEKLNKILNKEEYAKLIVNLRKTIHGKETILIDENVKIKLVINFVIISLYLYMLNEFECENELIKFLLVRNMFGFI